MNILKQIIPNCNTIHHFESVYDIMYSSIDCVFHQFSPGQFAEFNYNYP